MKKRFSPTQLSMFLAAISCAVLLLTVCRVPQGLYADPAWQLKAVQQYRLHVSPSLNHLVQPDPRDLSKDAAVWDYYWSPGTPLLVYPFVALGLSVGLSVRILSAIFLCAGTLGWIRWFGRFRIPTAILLALAVLLPWMRYASTTFFNYYSEILIFGSVPWILVLVEQHSRSFAEPRGMRFWSASVAIGLGLGLLFVIKNSAILISLGCIAYLWLTWWQGPKRHFPAGNIALSLAALLPVITLSYLNRHFGGHTSFVAEQTHAGYFNGSAWINLLGYPAMAMADASALVSWLLFHPSRHLHIDPIWLAILGIPGSLAVWWLVYRHRPTSGPQLLALCVILTTLAGLAAIWTLTEGASVETRHLAVASIALLPLALEAGAGCLKTHKAALRTTLYALGGVYLLVPLLYGVVTVVGKVRSTPRNIPLGPSRVANAAYQDDINQVATQLSMSELNPGSDVWYLPDPLSSLDLPGRQILSLADFVPIEMLQQHSYVTTRPLRAHILALPQFAKDGKLQAIQQSFVQSTGWKRVPLTHTTFEHWVSDLDPGISPSSRMTDAQRSYQPRPAFSE